MRPQLLGLVAFSCVARSTTSGFAVPRKDDGGGGRLRTTGLRNGGRRRRGEASFRSRRGSVSALMLTKDTDGVKGGSRSSDSPGTESSEAPSWDEGESATDGKLVLPIFPLRKSVRLPTESLTLNLYEDRYLALAEYVLRGRSEDRDSTAGLPRWSPTSGGSDDQQVERGSGGQGWRPGGRFQGAFGALYSGSCPQLVPGGAGPITPILERGDVGVVCMVYASQEAHVPTLGSTPRRRIRLVADGVARFRVDRVVQSGYGTPESGPFILVEASLVSDLPLSRSDAVEFDRLVDSASVRGGLRIRSWPELPVALDAMLAYQQHPGVSTRELLSFAVASRRMEVAGSAANSRARLALLRSRNPLERLRSVL